MRSLFLAMILSIGAIYASEKKIEIVTSEDIDNKKLKEALLAKDITADIVSHEFQEYKKTFKKSSRFLKRAFQSLEQTFFPPALASPFSDDVSKIIFYNADLSSSGARFLQQLPKEKLVLFTWEPPVVYKKMFYPETLSCFSKIYTWNDDLVDGKKIFKFYYPSMRPMIEPLPSFEEKKLCTLMATFVERDHPLELCSERARAIDFFEKKEESGFEFYGRYWDKEKHPAYRGGVKDKIETIKNYRFSICYENCICTGYITEKIFDCFRAGVVPIYLGAPNVEKFIPKECFIDRREFKEMEELYSFIKEMPKEKYESYLVSIRAFLKSPQAQLFTEDKFLEIFSEAVK